MTTRKYKSQTPLASTQQSAVEAIDRIRTIVEHLDQIAISMSAIPEIDILARDYLNQLREMLSSIIQTSSNAAQFASRSQTPAKWLERKNKKETPIDFIRREYAPWLRDGTLSRPFIRKIDKSLYAALSNWLLNNRNLPADLDLPTKKQLNDRRLKEVGTLSLDLPPEARERRRLYQLARRRSRPQ
jgi:hypothetical protein